MNQFGFVIFDIVYGDKVLPAQTNRTTKTNLQPNRGENEGKHITGGLAAR